MAFANRPSGFASISATGRVAENLALYRSIGHIEDGDPGAIPDDNTLDGIVTCLVDGIATPLADTALQNDIQDLLWSLVTLFHYKVDRIQRMLDDNESQQRDMQHQQDGSEVNSVKLERLIDKGQLLQDKRDAFERMRDQAAQQFEEQTGSVWRPRSGSMVSHKTKTAAVIDSRDYISAKRRAETEVMLPAGPKVAFAGGLDCNDHIAIWKVLDAALEKHPGMVLIHGGNKKGAEAIATAWAANRKVTCIHFEPDWNRDGKQAAPFKRNERILDLLPIGLIVFPGNGYTNNLADGARRLRLPVWDYRNQKGGS